jgi:hypothetical protein
MSLALRASRHLPRWHNPPFTEHGNAFNGGLPPEFYALCEFHAGQYRVDLLSARQQTGIAAPHPR